MSQPGYAKIIHPETGNTAEVPLSSLPYHYRAGWAPLDETPEPEKTPDPAPVRAPKAKDSAKDSSKEGE